MSTTFAPIAGPPESQSVPRQQNVLLAWGAEHGMSGVRLSVLAISLVAVVSAFAVPRYLDAVERSRAAEAFNFLASVRAAQIRHLTRQAAYAGDLRELDIMLGRPKYFTVAQLQPGRTGELRDSWTLALTRKEAPERFGEYTVVFNEAGFDEWASTIQRTPEIRPAP